MPPKKQKTDASDAKTTRLVAVPDDEVSPLFWSHSAGSAENASPDFVILFAHGAGAGAESSWMVDMASLLTDADVISAAAAAAAAKQQQSEMEDEARSKKSTRPSAGTPSNRKQQKQKKRGTTSENEKKKLHFGDPTWRPVFSVARFHFPYFMRRAATKKKYLPDKEPILLSSFHRAIAKVRQRFHPHTPPLFLMGKSIGARMASVVATTASLGSGIAKQQSKKEEEEEE